MPCDAKYWNFNTWLRIPTQQVRNWFVIRVHSWNVNNAVGLTESNCLELWLQPIQSERLCCATWVRIHCTSNLQVKRFLDCASASFQLGLGHLAIEASSSRMLQRYDHGAKVSFLRVKEDLTLVTAMVITEPSPHKRRWWEAKSLE